ncbi:hypothetical protein ACFQ1R_15385 [Mariniflexile jejuense]|uniref:Uncharacterized protein n=1 Tax=Mariniflexile jejuense TaxID=1173582 RepID=A0ABW3JN06_9FLAO
MKRQITFIILLLSFNSFSQKTLVLEDLQLNEKTRLIGMYPHYDEKRTYENYNFLIEDSNIIDSISKIIVKGKEIMNQSTRQEFTIWLCDGDKRLKYWSFDPKYNFIRIEGKSYEFDANQILKIAEKYGFSYVLNKKYYQTQEQFDKDYANIKTNSNLLFFNEPIFKFEGSFEISYPKTNKFKHPKAISQYLAKKISEFRTEDEYRVYYVANDYNIKNRNQFTMTIESDFRLYELFSDKNCKKGDWKTKEYSAYIFLKN